MSEAYRDALIVWSSVIRTLDEAELWLFFVSAALVGVLVGEIAKHQKSAATAGWLHVIAAVAGIAYFVHLLRIVEPWGSDHLAVGIRAFLVGVVVHGVTGLMFFAAALVWRFLRATTYRVVCKPLLAIWRFCFPKKPEPAYEDVELPEPELTDDERDELFERKMNEARRKFARRCQVINEQTELDEFERHAAITKARSTMTSAINDIMENYG